MGVPSRKDALIGNIATEKVVEALTAHGAILPALKPFDVLLRATAEIGTIYDFGRLTPLLRGFNAKEPGLIISGSMSNQRNNSTRNRARRCNHHPQPAREAQRHKLRTNRRASCSADEVTNSPALVLILTGAGKRFAPAWISKT